MENISIAYECNVCQKLSDGNEGEDEDECWVNYNICKTCTNEIECDLFLKVSENRNKCDFCTKEYKSQCDDCKKEIKNRINQCKTCDITFLSRMFGINDFNLLTPELMFEIVYEDNYMELCECDQRCKCYFDSLNTIKNKYMISTNICNMLTKRHFDVKMDNINNKNWVYF